jgi:protein-tyrosine-phosphatase
VSQAVTRFFTLERKGMTGVHIVFVCTGNTCRSPMAAHLARAKFLEMNLPHTVDSAGTFAGYGQPMTQYAVDAMIRRQIPVQPHQSKPVTPDLIEKADLVLTMTRHHARDLKERFPQAAEKIYPLRAYVADTPDEAGAECGIVDPFGGDDTHYESCAKELEQLIDQLAKKLSSQTAE